MELNPNPDTHQKLKELAKKEGVSVNAMLIPYLNDIATGKLVRVSYYVPPQQGQKMA